MSLSSVARCAFVTAAVAALAACAQNIPTLVVAQPATAANQQSSASPPPANETVAYQANAQHTGYVAGNLRPPLTQAWAVNFGGRSGSAGYPVVGNGIVVLPANDDLVALNATTGRVYWTKPPPKDGDGWNAVAYDNRTIFASPYMTHGKHNFGVFAFDEKTGKKLWGGDIVGEYSLSAPPTVASGRVYVSSAGIGGGVYAFSESKGHLLWAQPVKEGDNSSPAVSPSGAYVSYVCPQTYDFNPRNGDLIWHYSGSCYGGGGSTPSLYDGLLFVQDGLGSGGSIFTANTGTLAGGFDSDFTPAFAHDRGFFVNNGSSSNGPTLEAVHIPSIAKAWSVTLSESDGFATPPLVVGNTVFIETMGGQLLGYDYRTGAQVVSMNLGYGSGYQGPSVGLGYGAHMLIVPRGSELIGLKGS